VPAGSATNRRACRLLRRGRCVSLGPPRAPVGAEPERRRAAWGGWEPQPAPSAWPFGFRCARRLDDIVDKFPRRPPYSYPSFFFPSPRVRTLAIDPLFTFLLFLLRVHHGVRIWYLGLFAPSSYYCGGFCVPLSDARVLAPLLQVRRRAWIW
jgi:hypothetical protein